MDRREEMAETQRDRELVLRLEELAGLEEQREQKERILMADEVGIAIRGLSLFNRKTWKAEATPEKDEILTVARNMKDRGGSFLELLGAALFHADMENALKIKIAFPDYWVKYGGKALPDKPDSADVLQRKAESYKRAYSELYDATRALLDVTEYDGQGSEIAELRRVIWDESDSEAQREAEGKSCNTR